MTRPTDLLFAASRKLAASALVYEEKVTDLDVHQTEMDVAEDALHRAARDYAAVADAIDGQHYQTTKMIADDVVARITSTVAAPATEPAP